MLIHLHIFFDYFHVIMAKLSSSNSDQMDYEA